MLLIVVLIRITTLSFRNNNVEKDPSEPKKRKKSFLLKCLKGYCMTSSARQCEYYYILQNNSLYRFYYSYYSYSYYCYHLLLKVLLCYVKLCFRQPLRRRRRGKKKKNTFEEKTKKARRRRRSLNLSRRCLLPWTFLRESRRLERLRRQS